MKNYLTKRLNDSQTKVNILVLFSFFIAMFGFAQTGPCYMFDYETGTYTPLAASTGIELLVPTDKDPDDEGLSAAIPIGFTFIYNKETYTSFKVSANGFVTFDSALPVGTQYYVNRLRNASTQTWAPQLILAAMWDDLYINPGGNISYQLVGSAGSRILKIEFNDLTFVGYIGGAHLKYQVWLYEGTNVIEYRYGSNTTDMGDWLNYSGGISIGMNDERDSSFISITPGLTPTYSLTVPNDGIYSKDYITLGLIYRFTPIDRWQGFSNSNWLSATNWEKDDIPSESDHAQIPGGRTNNPVISGSGAICDNLYIETGATLTINGGGELSVNGDLINEASVTVGSSSESNTGSLIVKGNSTGEITFERYMDSNGTSTWHLISSPVVGQSINSFVSGSSLATNADKYGLGYYNEDTDTWTAYTSTSVSGSGDFESGKGYEILPQSSGSVSFTGTLKTSNVSISLDRMDSEHGWNLVGNPFSSALGAKNDATSAEKLLANNASSLDPSHAGLYLWDPDASGDYLIINNSGGTPSGTLSQSYIQAGQGFFVRANTNGANFSISRAMQTHKSDAAFKSGTTPWPSINITAESNDKKSSTLITFDSEMTNGLDVTYDAGTFDKDADFLLYSRLVDDNGVDFAIQCLPEDYDNLVVPLGLNAGVGSEITIKAKLFNLPSYCEPFLEDRVSGKFTSLENSGSYTIVFDERYNNLNALFLHTSRNQVTDNKIKEDSEPFKVITNRADDFIRVISSHSQPALAQVFDITGRVVLSKEISYGNNNLIRVNGKTGIYVLRINSENYSFSQKIFWDK